MEQVSTALGNQLEKRLHQPLDVDQLVTVACSGTPRCSEYTATIYICV